MGLDHDEQHMVAMIVRLYPRNNPYESYYYSILPSDQKVIVSKLTAILRIADSIDASHKEKAKRVNVSLKPDKLALSCESPADMSFEQWAFEHRCGLFEDVMGIKPVFKSRREG